MTNLICSYLCPFKHRTLIGQFVRRDVLGRYRGSLFGLGWALLTPIIMLGIYTFVFVEIFNARWGNGAAPANSSEFALQLFTGLIVFNLFAEVVSHAPTMVLEYPNLVKKVVFPIEVLPWAAVFTALFQFMLNLGVLMAAIIWMRESVYVTALALPLILLPFLALLLGLGWFLAATGVYLRDTAPLVGMLLTGMMFVSPIFYPASALPRWLQPFMQFNPLTVPIEQLRRILLEGHWPDWGPLGLYGCAACVLAFLGARWFQVTRQGFADVL